MTREYRITTIADIAALTPDQRKRCLVDLATWLDFNDKMQPLVDAGLVRLPTGMIWCDDDRTGEVSGLRIVDPISGRTVLEKDL